MGWLERLSQGLAKTREMMRDSMDRLMNRGPDPATLDELASLLIAADIGVPTVERLMERLRLFPSREQFPASLSIADVVKQTILETLESCNSETLDDLIERTQLPFVLLAVGVNGVGKTTTIAKLAQRFCQSGRAPLLVAADTFRAAAIEQLDTWAGQLQVDMIKPRHGADPAAVAFDGIVAARARAIDIVLIDTAGRLHTKTNLMDELRKIKRVLAREMPGAPHEVLLTLDATVGQNALLQAKQFHETVGVTGLAITKLDGTARGGIVVAIAEALKIPVRFIGVGEGAEDLQDFHAREFVQTLFEQSELSGRA